MAGMASSPFLAGVVADQDRSRAIDALFAAVAADPKNEQAAIRLTDLIRASPATPFPEPDRLAKADPVVRQAHGLLEAGRDEEAELLLRRHLAANSKDVIAMLVMAEIAARCGFPENAEKILRRSIEYDPQSIVSRVALARLLHGRALAEDKFSLVEELLSLLDDALAIDPDDWDALSLRASISVQIRRLDNATATFERMLALRPDVSFVWMNYAYLLKTTGSFGEAVAAYRTAIALDGGNGGAWWGLANLKTFQFFPSDIVQMTAALAQPLTDTARVEIRFALAKGLDDAKEYSSAAGHLLEGNRLRLQMAPYHTEEVQKGIDEAIRTYTPSFFSRRKGHGHPDKAPIFVIGMPRSGSTLIEQILSSHSMVEGTEELFAMQQLDAELQEAHGGTSGERALGEVPFAGLKALGERYLHLSHYHRKTDRERFTDKNPANWRYAGLIHAILPNAKIVDVRRNPLDCCFANYMQHYQWGVNFSYGQSEVASQYREYLRFMRHLDSAAPGAVYHAIHDDLVDSLEQEVRRLLKYLELPFEEQCLRFFETKRAIHTPSAEQVRKPINRSGFGRWRNYEPWLGELQHALAETASDWR